MTRVSRSTVHCLTHQLCPRIASSHLPPFARARPLVLASSRILPHCQYLSFHEARVHCDNHAIRKERNDLLEVNAPEYTWPPPLNTPERSPEASKISHWWRVGKAYGKFYWTGSKRIWANRKETRPTKLELQRLLNLNLKDPTSGWHQFYERYMCRSYADLAIIKLCTSTYGPVVAAEGPDDKVRRGFERYSRADLQALIRYERDRAKLPVFVLAVVLLGEWLAVLMPFLPVGMFPRACRTPSQVRTVYANAERARGKSFAQGVEALSDQSRSLVKSMANTSTKTISENGRLAIIDFVATLSERQVSHLATCLNTRDRRSQLCKQLQYLLADDILLHRAGNSVARLSLDELRITCHERGMAVVDKSESDLRRALTRYAELVGNDKIGKIHYAAMLLTESGWQKVQSGRWTLRDATGPAAFVPIRDRTA